MRSPVSREGVVTRLPLAVLVSIDTEEDNWVPTRGATSLGNVRELPRLQALLERWRVRPTYFVSYQVATDRDAASVLRELCAGGRAEIGAHLHPWNTPPLSEPFTPRNTMLKNLPPAVQVAKLQRLTEAVGAIAGERPRAFRAGRWGLGPETVAALIECGYAIDSSVMPFVDWRETDGGTDFFGAPLMPYRLGPDRDVRTPQPDGALLEIPVSAGYTRAPFQVWGRVHRALDAPSVRALRLTALASRFGLRRVVLSPETAGVADLLQLSHRLIERKTGVLHLFWHSPSLRPGLTPFTATASDVARLYTTLEEYFAGLERLGAVTYATIGEWGALPRREALSGAHGE
jgi:hypothetical protein